MLNNVFAYLASLRSKLSAYTSWEYILLNKVKYICFEDLFNNLDRSKSKQNKNLVINTKYIYGYNIKI